MLKVLKGETKEEDESDDSEAAYREYLKKQKEERAARYAESRVIRKERKKWKGKEIKLPKWKFICKKLLENGQKCGKQQYYLRRLENVNFYSCAMAATERDMDFLLKLRKLLSRETSKSIKYLSAENAMKKKEKLSIKTLIKMEQVCAILAQAKQRNNLRAKAKVAALINNKKKK